MRVLVGHSSSLLRDVLREALEGEGVMLDPPVAGLAELRTACRLDPPAVAIAGLGFPDGALAEAITEILLSGARLLVLCRADEARAASALLFAGAAGCVVVDDAGRDDVLAAVRTVADGRAPLHPAVASAVLNQWRAAQERSASSERLSGREMEVLRLLAEGLPTRTAAGALAVSPKTIEAHLARIMVKLGARNRTHLVALAAERGLLSDPRPTPETRP